ncbi:hypothetical protein Tco_1251083, partial [Tanacetum coccineum]
RKNGVSVMQKEEKEKCRYCSRLVIDARNFRLQAQYEVEYMWKCHATLSKVITTLSKLCKEKWSECYAEGRKGKM